jgi:hypothetical protein
MCDKLETLDTGLLGALMGRRPVAAPRLLRCLASEGVRAIDIAAGSHHSLVTSENQGCWAFGSNQWWQLGLTEAVDMFEPAQVCALEKPPFMYDSCSSH